jgi:hypothetical protein
LEFAAEAEPDEELELLLEEPHPAARSASERKSTSVVAQRRFIRVNKWLSRPVGGADSVGRRQ